MQDFTFKLAEKKMSKKTLGRQKIEIKKLEKKSNKQVTFSKRRSGLIKKAGELCVLCGAEVAIIVVSPNGKFFCFGHPSVDAVTHRYLHGSPPLLLPQTPSPEVIAEFNKAYMESMEELESLKKKNRSLEKEKKELWWENDDADVVVEGMGVEELEQYLAALYELRTKVAARNLELIAAKGSCMQTGVMPPPLATASFRGDDHGGLCPNDGFIRNAGDLSENFEY